MIDQPTPETDALHELRNREFRDILSQYFEMVDLARRMERERDHLREQLAKERALCDKFAALTKEGVEGMDYDDWPFIVDCVQVLDEWKEARRE